MTSIDLMTNRLAIAMFLLVLPCATSVWAQADNRAAQNLERFERQLDQTYRSQRNEVNRDVPVDQRMLFEYGFTLSANFLALDDTNQETHFLRQTSGSAFVHANFDGVHDFFLRASSSYDDFNEGDAFDDDGDDWVEPTLDRAIYTFDLGRYLSAYEGKNLKWNVVIQGGRQLVHWANGLTLSQEIDGGLVTINFQPFELQILAGTTRSSANDFESSRPSFDNDTHRNFFGGMLKYNKWAKHQPFVYGLVQLDENENETLVTVGNFGLINTTFHYDSFYLGGGSQGSLTDRLLYGVEGVYQGGTSRSNSFDTAGVGITQTDERIQAWALDARLDYIMPGANRTRLSAEIIAASGDKDRGHSTNTFNGNTPGTRDNAFNGFGLVDTGLAFAPNASNLLMLRLGTSTFPLPNSPLFRRMQIGANLFFFNKMSKEGGITETTSNNRYLGFEPDIYAIWQVTSDVTVQARYGVFFPGKAIATDNDERHFFFTGVSYSF